MRLIFAPYSSVLDRATARDVRAKSHSRGRHRRPVCWLLGHLKLNRPGFCNTHRGIDRFDADKVPISIVIENDAGLIFIAFRRRPPLQCEEQGVGLRIIDRLRAVCSGTCRSCSPF